MSDGKPTHKVGNLTRDPELRYSAKGTPFAKFAIAVENWVPEPKDRTTSYYDVVAFGSLGEHAAECLRKGDRVVVCGEGKVGTWKGRDGVERETREIVADGLGPDLRFATCEVQREHREAPDDEEPF